MFGDDNMISKNKRGITLAILAAALYAISSPFSKLLLDYIPSTLMAGFLYLGAGIGMTVISLLQRISGHIRKEEKLSEKELPYTIAMIVLDIAAPICMLLGLSMTTAANASLLNNFEIVATSFIALLIFKERISSRLWLGIIAITISCMILSFENISNLYFSKGSLFVLLAACCWGLENNCTRKISSKDPLQIVFLKGIFSGSGSLVIGLVIGERLNNLWIIPCVLLLGFIAYGLSIYTYVYAQRLLGASRTSAYYAVSPFIGVFLSLIMFHEIPKLSFCIALLLMLFGAWLSSNDKPLKNIFSKRMRED